jgi:hypothetical protein
MVRHVPSATFQDRLLAETWRVLRPAQSLTFANSIVTYIQYEYYFGTQHETSTEVRQMLWYLLAVFVVSLIFGGALEMGSYIRGQEMESRHIKEQ